MTKEFHPIIMDRPSVVHDSLTFEPRDPGVVLIGHEYREGVIQKILGDAHIKVDGTIIGKVTGFHFAEPIEPIHTLLGDIHEYVPGGPTSYSLEFSRTFRWNPITYVRMFWPQLYLGRKKRQRKKNAKRFLDRGFRMEFSNDVVDFREEDTTAKKSGEAADGTAGASPEDQSDTRAALDSGQCDPG